MDPFVVLGIPPTMAVDLRDLEQRYFALSRESHPDFRADTDPNAQIATLRRSAKINDAYRRVRDPWLRAEALVELSSPGVLKRTKQLCPAFLGEMLELAEEVTEAGDAQREALRARLVQQTERYLATVSTHVEQRQWDKAATALHEARYLRKSLRDLEAKT